MKILFVVSEVEDLVKTGGLADVAKSLPLALRDLSHEVLIVMPYYQALATQFSAAECAPKQILYSEQTPYEFAIREIQLQGLRVLCVDYPDFFARKGLYSDDYHAYPDNAERFAFFAHAALKTAQAVNFQPDIVHCNDWHTALTPYFLHIDDSGFFNHSKSIFTIHNGAYQGTHRFVDIPYLRPHHQLAAQLDGDALNFVRMGIRYATKINTVSPNYAQELLTPLGSHHLFYEFTQRRGDVSGILNGCDYSQWDPVNDPHIIQTYDSKNFKGKAACKADLQKELTLPAEPKTPVIGMVCRLTEQKGFGFILPMLDKLMQHKVQLAIVGTGDPDICRYLHDMAQRFPQKLAFHQDFSVRKAHMIEAGSDFFLMPSLFEPCGLNQMYSLAFATLPIVRAVGGLKDTVVDVAEDPQAATGFVFEQPNDQALLACVQRALLFYHEFPEKFALIQQRAMQTRFTWQAAAKEYEKLYLKALG
ncbi:glycogen synthase GlgA [Paraglaciecola hydrolytica]|uniref:Glycogen synthase n=1 Tax=Paraglaciecola hydrolytica TaxID=1799789 RepID=A0A136A5E4_9ALTE|nr:glycogen synthase GlgA [Paraglaciecola hydrolytica]KXI30350.1 glycogen synthase [Paraglaciecola hydrolytica]